MTIKNKSTWDLAPRSYEDSLGAHAMDEDIPRKMERSAYNYLDIKIDDPGFSDASPLDFSLQFQQFALFNAGSKAWDETAKILISAADQAELTDDPLGHPIWIALIRHAKMAPNEDAAIDLLSHAKFRKLIDHKSWDKMTDAVKYEGLLYTLTKSGDLPKRLSSAKRITSFFGNELVRAGALISAGKYYLDTNNQANAAQCEDLLKATCKRLYNLDLVEPAALAFAVTDLRFRRLKLSGQVPDALEFLGKAWQKLANIPPLDRSRQLRYKAMNGLYNKRLEAAQIAGQTDLIDNIRQEWRDYLLMQLSNLSEAEA